MAEYLVSKGYEVIGMVRRFITVTLNAFWFWPIHPLEYDSVGEY